MKQILINVFLTVAILISCSRIKDNNAIQSPKRVVITGKIVNLDPDHNELKLQVNRIGLPSTQLSAKLDKDGNFSTYFESYIPTDVWFIYRTRFLVITHPGDSIYVEFDGALREPEIFESIKFKGDAIQVNLESSIFQKLLTSNIYSRQDKRKQALKDYCPEEFVSYADSVKNVWDFLFNQFISEYEPSEETKKWASEHIYSDYLERLSSYYGLHPYYNNAKREDLILPNDFYKPIICRRPIDRSMLVSGYALSINLNNFNSALYRTLKLREKAKQIASVSDNAEKAQKAILDSLIVSSVIKYSPDNLYRKIMLTELFSKRMYYESDYEIFENHQKIAKNYINEPFLWEPLYKQYIDKKAEFEVENMYDLTPTLTRKHSCGQILDSIIQTNKSKVIYLDFWATWCGPCKAEMPNSKLLMEQMHDKNVAFAFICLHSDEKDWQPTIKKLDIGGQHYFLSKKQSIEFARFYAINGVPNYMLINKQGNIVEQGIHLRPNIVKNKIEKLLND